MNPEGTTVGSDEARTGFRELIDKVEHDHEHIVITRWGKPVAVIVPYDWHKDAVAALLLEEAR